MFVEGKVHTTDPTRPFKQDLPPKGGYEPITFKRIPARQIVSAKILIPGFLLSQALGAYSFLKHKRFMSRLAIENTSSDIALEPLMLAERDRSYLIHLRNMRDYEEQLMADVPGWKVGTWFGQKVYQTVPDSKVMRPSPYEYYVHADARKAHLERNFKRWFMDE